MSCSDSKADRILSKQQQDASLKVSSYCIKIATLRCLISDTPGLTIVIRPLDTVMLCLSLCPYFPHYIYDGVHRSGTGRLNSSPQQFNLTKCPFIMCVVGLQHTSRLNTAALADLVRDTSKVSTSSSALVITSIS